MRQQRSSIGQELLWLIVWAVIFVAIAVLMLKFVVPHHFNDRIAIAIAAIVSSLSWIALRGYAARRA